jgi:hypothetical protein
VELQAVKSEILSYGEIIKVLQEELYKKELNKAGSPDYNDYYYYYYYYYSFMFHYIHNSPRPTDTVTCQFTILPST